MRTAFALLLITAGLGFLLFIKINSDNIIREYKYIGVKRCKSCHSSIKRGNQYEIWEKSAHSQAMIVLSTQKAKEYAKKINIKDPKKDVKCLKCHTTAYNKEVKYFENSFNFNDGVQCEACHNPGSEYSKYQNMISEKSFQSNGGEKGNLNDCYQCHIKDIIKSKDEKCPFQVENFDSGKKFQIIKHPIK